MADFADHAAGAVKNAEGQEKPEYRSQAKEASGASVWNQAGTFEERDVTAWAESELRACLAGLKSPDAAVTVTALTQCKGDAHIWFVRGKKRCGFDFELELSWADTNNSDIKGTARVCNASADELHELGLQVALNKDIKNGNSEAAQRAVKAAKALLPQLLAQLNAFHERLKLK